jgi:uncharacterized membrane protein
MLTRIKRAFMYRVASLIVTSLVGWAITGNPLIGISIGAVDMVIKLALYYCHETIWERKMTKDIKKIKKDHKKRSMTGKI